MQKDLLAELQLPKLNLKSLQNIITKNSARLACVIKENNEFLVKSKRIPPGFKVIVGASAADVNFPFSVPEESVKTIKRQFVLTKINDSSFKNGLKKSSAVTKSTKTSPDKTLESNTNDEIKWTEIRRSSVAKRHSDSKIIVGGASNLVSSPVSQSNVCTRKEGLMGLVAGSPSNDDIDIRILLDKNSNKGSDFSPKPLNSHRSILKPDIITTKPSLDTSVVDNVVSSTTDDLEHFESTSNVEESSDPALCVISEVIGNADTAFSDVDEPDESEEERRETQVITPKKTNDITKIKGWRRKQFFVEKPTTVEFYSVSKGSLTLKKKIDNSADSELEEEPGNKENAFVCDSLDDFLEQEAELKIGYEIPHLYAEFGIKLTSDEIFSKPNLSENDIKEVENRYSVPISLPLDYTNLDEIKEENIKGVKRPIEEDLRHSKALKLDEYKKHAVRLTQNQAENFKTNSRINDIESENRRGVLERNVSQLNRSNSNVDNIKLLSKLIAVVVYPSPFSPLHPIVQYHLNKIRSFRTKIDENWANFAVSAVRVKEQRKRRILPVYCCVKIKENLKDPVSEQTEKIGQLKSEKKIQKKAVKLKQCSVVIKRLEPYLLTDPWCMEHSCYHCAQCGLDRKVTAHSQIPSAQKCRKIRNVDKEDEEHGEIVTVSPRASFNRKIARLLAKKVRLLRVNGDTLTSIDCLRILTRDTIEFIKLKFIKESFLAGEVNIWYLKPGAAAVRSRAFLTFSQNSPVPDAVNLKLLTIKNLPKVITEIVSVDNTCDSNEYAILHCNGGIWEIHGSLNITFGKSDKNVEQIFTSLDLPELKKLQEIAEKILHVKAVKWWVLDLTQKFKLIELKSGNISTVVTRKKFFDVIELNSYGFIPLKDSENRILGAYVIQRLLPFVLIGPYYLLETRDMILKGVSSTVPFKYYGEENVTTNYPLKFFINSVIKNLEKSSKKLEGLWLYDKMCLDKTSYIEVVTSNAESTLPEKCSAVDIEHGYSLNSLTNSSPSGATSGIIKRDDGKDELQTVTVYLYFDIFELGYVEGELQFDNSVIIKHPLNERTKMKSHKIGDRFVSIIRRRLEFFPKDLEVRWFITKYKDDLRERPPFNKLILGGAHILTKNGVYFLLEMTDSKMVELGLTKSDIIKVMSQCQVLNEVRELKNLASLFLNDSTRSLSMDEVLNRAINEVRLLRTVQTALKFKKEIAEKQKSNLGLDFIKLVNAFRIGHRQKIKMIKNIDHLFRTKNGELSVDFKRILEKTRIGWKYLKYLERTGDCGSKSETPKELTDELNDTLPADNIELANSLQKFLNTNIVAKKPQARVLSPSRVIVEDPQTNNHLKVTRLRPISDEFGSLEIRPAKDFTSSCSEKELPVRNIKSKILITEKPKKNFTEKEGFLKLTAETLPNNIKLSWNKWNVKNFEVA